ncbi:hypothetical protein MIMGU_mgv1a016723mg [Erythranthe guttata]|uniref:Uncharacterized protein n=1 Tax=Erythranthe guttata TaxID=4155 RepID=A0A022QD72_ERYGU|nr:hypothetical protein MIMGU_mgv1a016723mg [Erythranthe guttata]
MYRPAARQLLPALRRRTGHFQSEGSPVGCSAPIVPPASFLVTAASENARNHKPNSFESANHQSSSTSSGEGRNPRFTAGAKALWQEEQASVLQASLRHVVRSHYQIFNFI